MGNKLLVAVNDLKDILFFKNLDIKNFAIPLKDFALGYKNLFSFEQINELSEEVYVIINRLLNYEEIDKLRILLSENKKIKGIILSDIGVFKMAKEVNPKLELIWNIEHFGTNYKSLNYWIKKGCTSAFIANEITLKQVDEILNNINIPLVVQIFGYPIISYSRRLLLSNYNRYYNFDKSSKKITKDKISKNEFIFLENEYGCSVYNKTPYDGREILKLKQDDKIKYYFINYNFLTLDEIINVINNLDGNIDLKCQNGFLHKKTIYKIKEGE